jgi:hypothetical protein
MRPAKTAPKPAAIASAPKYDVAISFLARDEAFAKQVAEQLEEGLSIFFFPHTQEELVGTNGLESMREPFLDARVVVVLFRAPWGGTPWTRVEETAIGERCLKHGWPSLVFVQLDKASALPKWLPETHIRFSAVDYTIDQLVGGIKVRVQEHGGTIVPLDAMGEAKRVQREATYLADRESLMRDRRWIEENVHRSLRATMQEIIRLVDEANTAHGFQIQRGANDMSCVLRSGFVSMGIGWHQPIFNLVCDRGSDECHLRVVEFSGTLILPGERAWVMQKPRMLKEHRFKVEVALTRELVWVERGKREHIMPGLLADRIVKLFLSLISRANQGKVERPPL